VPLKRAATSKLKDRDWNQDLTNLVKRRERTTCGALMLWLYVRSHSRAAGTGWGKWLALVVVTRPAALGGSPRKHIGTLPNITRQQGCGRVTAVSHSN
jgi:hypothetical protein